MNVDLDEFVFSKENYKKIPDIINLLDNKVNNLGQIKFPWIIFSSNNHIKQPESVIKYFTDRNNFVNNPSKHNCKYLAKTKLLDSLDIHFANISGVTVLSNGKIYTKNKFIIDNNDLKDQLLQLNHYVLQSREWFLNVKCTRGAADCESHQNIRNLDYFNKYNNLFTGYTDLLLKNKKY
tara:strand:+ start:4958 stop:5494 length:537 start_codon:yes stop_codon:yes gene_type:complete